MQKEGKNKNKKVHFPFRNSAYCHVPSNISGPWPDDENGTRNKGKVLVIILLTTRVRTFYTPGPVRIICSVVWRLPSASGYIILLFVTERWVAVRLKRIEEKSVRYTSTNKNASLSSPTRRWRSAFHQHTICKWFWRLLFCRYFDFSHGCLAISHEWETAWLCSKEVEPAEVRRCILFGGWKDDCVEFHWLSLGFAG